MNGVVVVVLRYIQEVMCVFTTAFLIFLEERKVGRKKNVHVVCSLEAKGMTPRVHH